MGVGNLDFCNIVGPNWELGIWEFIAKNDIVGGHLGKQKHWYSTVKGTRRTPNAVRQSEEMDPFFLGPTTGQRAVGTWVLLIFCPLVAQLELS